MNREAPARLGSTLLAALEAAVSAGCLIGLLDGVHAGWRASTSGVVAWIGCLAASSVSYGVVSCVAAVVLALVFHPWLRRLDGERVRRLCFTALLAGLLFLDLYWWTRPLLLYGVPATDPRRIALAVGELAVAALVAHLAVRLLWRRVVQGRTLVIAVVALTWCVGGAYLAWDNARTGSIGRLNQRNRELPNVLLFICDAMRSDVLGCYGNTRVKTPRIDRLAADGVLFENAFVQAPFTGSSFGSYFTGMYPRRHGFVKMTADSRMASNITLASHLKSAQLAGGGRLEPDDFHCVAFMTGALSHATGLVRGFDSYYEAFAGHDLVHVDSDWSVFRSELALFIVKAKLAQRLGDDAVASETVRWLSQHGRERFFAMVHLFATHTPYDPPADLRELYCDPSYAGPVSAFRSDHREAIEQGVATPTQADVEQIRNLYFAGVTHNDRMIASVLAELERLGTLDDTLVIVTADHGEELGERGLWEHNFMLQSNLRVPFVVSWPKKLPSGARIEALVESIDLVPSVCELIGLAAPFENRPDEHGRNYGSLDGASWVGLARGETQQIKGFSFAENGLEMSVQDLEWKLVVPAVELAGATLESLASNVLPPRLFHLGSDPDERTDVLAEDREQAERLFGELVKWDASMPIPRTDIVQSQRDIEQAARRLRALGYVDGVGQGAPPKPKSQ